MYALQVTIASTMVGLVEGLLYAHKAGLDVDAYLVRKGHTPHATHIVACQATLHTASLA